MTIKQIIIGGLLGVTALGTTLHRMAKSPARMDKPAVKLSIKSGARPAVRSIARATPRLSRGRKKQTSPIRLSLNHSFGD